MIATVLFFHATDLVKQNQKMLAAVEATQCGEVIFTLLGGVLVLGDPFPGVVSAFGLLLIVGGMIANSVVCSIGQGIPPGRCAVNHDFLHQIHHNAESLALLCLLICCCFRFSL